jgi:hypothetical protein
MPFLHRHGALKDVSEELSDRYTRRESVLIGELLPAFAAIDLVAEVRLPLKDKRKLGSRQRLVGNGAML